MFLTKHARPIVIFDPSNQEHREHYLNFLKVGTWGHCPYRFAAEGEEADNNLVYAMQRQLIEYYLSTEFDVETSEINYAI